MKAQDLEALVKTASDRMRSDDNTKLVTKYIEHLSWLLFLKVFDSIEDENELVDPSYIRVIPGKYRWQSWATQDWDAAELIAFVNDELLPFLRGLDGTHQTKRIASIFGGVTTVMKSGFGLREVIALVDQIDFHAPANVHTFSLVYESLLARLGREAGWSGEFYTPRPVVKLAVEIVQPRLGERVYDPAAGSAGFLVEAFEHMKVSEQTIGDHDQLQNGSFYGQESGELPFLLGSMNMLLHGVTGPNLFRRNTLEEDIRGIPPERQYDAILTNPPFGGKENPQIQQNFPVKAAATEVLFVQHVMAFLKSNGRACVVVPNGILFREDNAFAYLRHRLVDEFNLFAIVRLPLGVFPYATATRTNLLFFSRSASEGVIKFYRLPPPDGRRGFGKKTPITLEHVAGALAWIRDEIPDENAWAVTIDEVRDGGYDLDLLPPEESEPPTNAELDDSLATVVEDLGVFFDSLAPLAHGISGKVDEYAFSRVAKLGEFVEKRGAAAKSSTITQLVGVSNTGGLLPSPGPLPSKTNRYKRVEVGDFVYNPMRVDVGSIGLCRSHFEEGYASPDYVVFRLKDASPITSEFLLLYMQSPLGVRQIERNAEGSVRSRLYFENLQDVLIPVPEHPGAWEELLETWSLLTRGPRTVSSRLSSLLHALFRVPPAEDAPDH